MMACSTAKKTYENIFLKEKLMENTEYIKICAQLEDLKKRFPKIAVSIFGD